MPKRKVEKSRVKRLGQSLPAFQKVVETHGPKVLWFCVAQTGPAYADDCFQETMLSALRSYETVRDADAIPAWLFSIAARKAIDAHRADLRNQETSGVAASVDEVESSVELDDELWQAVRSLPDKQRYAVTLRFVADLRYVDVAQIMDTSAEAARRNVFEGLQRLRKEVKK